MKPTRPTSTEVAPKIAAIYATPYGGAGCCLHCQLDDGNLSDGNFTDEMRVGVEHDLCREVFDLMRQMKRAGRGKAVAKARAIGRQEAAKRGARWAR